jgi:hypothetical protein
MTDRQAAYMVDDDVGWPGNNCPAIKEAADLYQDTGDESYLAGYSALWIARCYYGYREDWVDKSDFIRLGTVTASYRLQEEWLERLPLVGIDQATVQVQAQNLWHWTKFPGFHPSALVGSAAYVDRAAGFILPPPKRFTLNLRLNF